MYRLGEYTFQVATEPALWEAAHRLRYRVYVEEYGFEKAEDHPDGLEQDPFDPYSVPIVAQDHKGSVVGTIRLILNSPLGLPALRMAFPERQREFGGHVRPAEVSRLTLDKDFRGASVDYDREMEFFLRQVLTRDATGNRPGEEASDIGLPKRVVVVLGLIHACFQVGQSAGVTHYLMTTERALWVLLKRYEVVFDAIGPEVDYHGRRIPFAAKAVDLAGPIGAFRDRVLGAMERKAPLPPALRERGLVEGLGFRFGGFHFVVASTEPVLQQVFRLRYEAYVTGMGLAAAADFPDGEHKDRYDPWSMHAVALDDEGKAVGTARLVLNSPVGFQCLDAVSKAEYPKLASTKKVAELSRLAMAEPFAGALVDVWSALLSMPAPSLAGTAVPTRKNRRQAAVVLLGLFRMLYRISKKLRLSGWCFLAKRSIIEIYRRHGVHAHPLGPPTQVLEGRAPYLLRFHEVEQQLLDFDQIRSFAQDLMGKPSRMNRGGKG